ncbi:GNAT family N-acetyltransferase [Chitinophagaceae bacterium MMS25-I14]
MQDILSVRPIQEKDIEPLTQYWLMADKAYLEGMGADITKVPPREYWYQALTTQIQQSFEEKQSFAVIWELNGKAVGHCNINKIIFGSEAYMHLHIWEAPVRKMGYGTQWIRMTLPFFFNHFGLERLYCEPYALNPAPNRTLEKTGFEFVKKHVTIPGALSFEQEANLWVLIRSKYSELFK